MINHWRSAVLMPVAVSPAWSLDGIVESPAWNLDELEAVLTEAIVNCAEANLSRNGGAIFTTLSGGLDSSFCLAKIRSRFGHIPIYTFTIVGGRDHPDYTFAKMVAEKFGTIHHTLIPTQTEIDVAHEDLHKTWLDEPDRLGNTGVYMLYEFISNLGANSVIAHDGIDELLGGYWDHRKHQSPEEKLATFQKFWGLLEKDHLSLLERKAHFFGIRVIFPYLQQTVVDYISRIPLDERTSFGESKIPMRTIARKYLPPEVITRNKRGFCSGLDKE
jgi:asparagine synthetase B (glutamine-hydrolysing)